jgi:hypothetical protein
MRVDFWTGRIWQWVDTTDALMVATIWIAVVAVLVVRFVRTRRWDAAWKRDWEHKHRRSLDALRTTKQRHLKNLVATRWVTLGLFVVGFVTSVGLILAAGEGFRRWPPVLLDALIVVNVVLLLGLIVLVVAVQLGQYQIRRLDELLAERPPTSAHT